MRRAVVVSLLACGVASLASADEAQKPPPPVRVAPGPSGFLGAWLVLGPYKAASAGVRTNPPNDLTTDPQTLAESSLASPCAGQAPATTEVDAPKWTVASSGEGPIDLISALKTAAIVKGATTVKDPNVIGYAAATLHLDAPKKLFLLLGTDDGVRVSVDGKVVLSREEARPERDDDDYVPLDLPAGDHPILLKLHQRDGAWSFHVRIVDELLGPPEGASLVLPGTAPDDRAALAAKMSWVSLDRGVAADGYRPSLTIRFPEGVPLDVALPVRVTLLTKTGPLFDVDAGEISPRTRETVVTLPRVNAADFSQIEDQAVSYAVSVAGRDLPLKFFPKKAQRETLARAATLLAPLTGKEPWLRPDTLESLTAARNRLEAAIDRGDGDDVALSQETRELASMLDAVAKQTDPYSLRTGQMRMAYRSPADDQLQEYALWVPSHYRPGAPKRYPLIVVLHGLNGRPMAVLRKFLGTGETGHEADWDERRTGGIADYDDAFIVAPSGHGNTMYRDLGEDDVMRVTDRVMARFSIDETRVTIAGPSMGGIGAAAIPFRYPDRFAAAEPLCGYHSYFVRRDFLGRPIRPWEKTIAEERSNAEWAFNGANIPLFIVHGKLDWPETNSGVLIDRYEQLHYSVEHEHPNLGHNVWTTTWEDQKGAKWLLGHHRVTHPERVRFRTLRLRNGKSDWVRVTELSAPDQWGEVDARITSRSRIAVKTSGVAEISLDRDGKHVDQTTSTRVVLDGATFSMPAGTPLVFHKDASGWQPGAAQHAGPYKRGEITGPIRDVLHSPILFVWGKDDPAQARANEEVARSWAAIRGGVTVKYPVMSDEEFLARGEALSNEKALFLVGNAKSNRILRALEPDLPIKLDGDAVVIGNQRLTGNQLGAAFVRPNPKRTDRYLVVVEGTSALGTWRSLSLPDLLPDFVVYDEHVAPARGQMLLSSASVLAAGFFGNDWSLPQVTADPLANTKRPSAKTEYDATPYLP